MLDERLREKSEIEATKAAVEALNIYPHANEIDAWIASWWRDWEAQLSVSGDAVWPEAAAEALRSARPRDDELSRAIELWLLHAQHDASAHSAAALLVCRTVGRLVGAGDVSYARFSRAERVVARNSHYGQAFFESFAEAVPSGANQSWIDEIATFSAILEDCCDSWPSPDAASEIAALRAEENRRADAGEKAELWGHREPRGVHPSAALIMRLRGLFALSPAAALAALDRVPSMAVRKLCVLFMSVNDDVDRLLCGVADAPLVWNGNAWTGSGVAALFIEAVTKHAIRIASAVQRPRYPDVTDTAAVERLLTVELPDLFRRLCATMLSRSDGRLLGIEYAAKLLRKTSWGRNAEQTQIEQMLLDVLLPALHAAGVRPTDVRRLARRRCRAGESSRRVEYASVAGFVVESATDGRDAWAEFVDLLLQAREDDHLVYGIDGYLVGTSLFVGLGRALSRTSSPVELWENAWRELYPQRERARFIAVEEKGLTSSAYLCLVGLGSLRTLIHHDLDVARRLWDRVAAALRGLAARSASEVLLKMRQLVALPWAFANHLFCTDWASQLESARGLFASDPLTALFAADFLVKNGIPACEVISRMRDAGCDPLSLAADAELWLEARGFGSVVNDVDVARLRADLDAASRLRGMS